MTITIKDLSFKCIIGILPFERLKKQKVIVNLCFKYKYKNKDSFIDYAQVVKDVQSIMVEKKFELLEEAIEHLQKKLTKKYPLKKLNISIAKPNILSNCVVSLSNN